MDRNKKTPSAVAAADRARAKIKLPPHFITFSLPVQECPPDFGYDTYAAPRRVRRTTQYDTERTWMRCEL